MTLSEVKEIYRRLLLHPGDREGMWVLANALEQIGHGDLADAYRWAAFAGKWPFVKTLRDPKRVMDRSRERTFFDWDGLHRINPTVPPHARLPKEIFDAIKRLKDRRYGDVNMAFVVLARALCSLKGKREERTGISLGSWDV